MSTKHSASRTARLGVELLEGRDVPSSAFTGPGGLSVAFGDVVTTRAADEYITATGPGRPGLVRVWDDAGGLIAGFRPFGGFTGGVYVAVGNVIRPDATVNPQTPDPLEIIVSTAAGTSGRVKVYSFGNGALQEVANFLAFGPNYSGGVQLAVGNVTGDNQDPSARKAEIVVGQQRGGSAVKVFSLDNSTPTVNVFELRSFNAYGPGYRGGITLDTGNIHTTPNVDTDPYDYEYHEIVTGKAAEAPQVKIFDVQTTNIDTIASYLAYGTGRGRTLGGINVIVGSTDGVRGAEIYVNPVGTARVRILDGWTSTFRGDFVVAVPPNSRNIYLAMGGVTDPVDGSLGPRDLIAVFTTGRFEQVPIIFPGALGSPAGLNGSYPAA